MEHPVLYRTVERLERLLFFTLLAAHLFVVWYMPVFLTQDGPSHLYNARILLELWNGDPTGLYSKFFTLNTTFSPNWTGNILLAGLLKLLPAVAAEKTLVSIYMIALPLAFRHATRVLGRGTPYLSSLIFLLTYNYHLVYGFFNFCLGLTVLFCFIAQYHRSRGEPSLKRGLGCTMLLLLMLATHPVALLIGYTMMACDGVLLLVNALRNAGEWPTLLKRAWRALAIAAPTLLLLLIFLPESAPDQPPLLENKWSAETWRALLRMDQLIVFEGAEGALFRVVVLLLAALLGVAVWKNRSFNVTSTGALLLTLLGCCITIHFFVSDQIAGGAYLTSRMALIVWMVFALYLATRELPVRAAAVGAISTALLSVSLLVIRYPAHARCGEQAAAYVEQCSAIPDGSTFLPLCFSDRGEFGSDTLSPRISIFKHMSGYVAAARPLISLDNYEANTVYFQTAWLPAVNPFRQLCASGDCNIEGDPISADIAGYEKRARCSIDFVVLWGDPARGAQQSGYVEFMRDLETSYTPTDASNGELFKLFAKKKQ